MNVTYICKYTILHVFKYILLVIAEILFLKALSIFQIIILDTIFSPNKLWILFQYFQYVIMCFVIYDKLINFRFCYKLPLNEMEFYCYVNKVNIKILIFNESKKSQ